MSEAPGDGLSGVEGRVALARIEAVQRELRLLTQDLLAAIEGLAEALAVATIKRERDEHQWLH